MVFRCCFGLCLLFLCGSCCIVCLTCFGCRGDWVVILLVGLGVWVCFAEVFVLHETGVFLYWFLLILFTLVAYDCGCFLYVRLFSFYVC